MRDPDPLSRINEYLAVDRTYLPEYDSHPRTPHPSHEWKPLQDRWDECSRCGVRDYWPGSENTCGRPTNGKTKVCEIEAWNTIQSDLEMFFVWWDKRKDTPSTLPSVDEWVANFFEWRKSNADMDRTKR